MTADAHSGNGRADGGLERVIRWEEPRPDSLPVYDGMRIDGRGRIWLRDHAYSGEPPFPWTVFDPSGQPLGRVLIPEIPDAAGGARLGRVGTRSVALIWRDDGPGFAHVTLHRLEPAGAREP